MIFFDANLWVLLSHDVKRWQYPLMNCDHFGTISFLDHILNILIHHAFNLPPSVSYLIWCLYPAWRRKVDSLLNFKPLSFAQVENCNQELGDLLLAPLYFRWLYDFFISLGIDDFHLVYDFHEYLI